MDNGTESLKLQVQADIYRRGGFVHKAIGLYAKAAVLLEQDGKLEGAKALRERIAALKGE